MVYPVDALVRWFGAGLEQDAQVLTAWHDAPLTYDSEQEIGPAYNLDRYEVVLGQDSTGELFDRAARLTLHNQFYPRDVMVSVSDYGLENRTVQPGDRVLQRILVLQFRGLPILEMLTMNEITQVIDKPRRAGFTYTTTAAHAEVGEWSPLVEWRENGEVVLVISVISRARPGSPAWARSLSRRLQLRAHHISIKNIQARLNGEPYIPAAQPPSRVMKLLPVGLLLLAVLMLLLGFSSGKETRG